MFCNNKKCVIHFHLRWWTCWTAAWNLFSNDMFYHTLCQSEVFTPHMHADTPDIQYICTKPCLRRTPPLVHLQDSQPWTFLPGQLVIMRWWSGPRDQQDSHLSHVCLSNFANQCWRVTLTAYMKCSCSPYSGVSTAAATRVLPVLSLSAHMTCCHEWSVCKDKHPSYRISHF